MSMREYDQTLIDAIVTYEEVFHFPREKQITEYFGDYGIHSFQPGVGEEAVEERLRAALEALGRSEEEVTGDPSFHYRSNLRKAMISCVAKENASNDLSDLKFTAEMLEGVCLAGACFRRCDFSDITQSGVFFDHARFLDCSFLGANLARCSFQNTEVYQCDFQYAKLREVSFEDAIIEQVGFQCADLVNCSIQNAIFHNVSFYLVSGHVSGVETAEFSREGDDSGELQDIRDEMAALFEAARDKTAVMQGRFDWAREWTGIAKKIKMDIAEDYRRENPYLDRVMEEYREYQKTQERTRASPDRDEELEL